MRPTSRRAGTVCAAFVLCIILTAPAFALVFSSSCDRFEIDGNSFGVLDGTPDFVDNFDDGMLAPSWTVLLGSAEETGGAVVIHNPGASVLLGATQFEISTIENSVHGIENGAGNFVASSYWSPTLPATNAELHMQLYSISPIIEAAGISVNNSSSDGYSLNQSVTHGVGSSFTTVQNATVPITAASVTGPIVLRCSLDDVTDMLTCSFSLDGGSTFQPPFPSMHVFNDGVTDYDILLGAAAFDSNPPPSSTQMLPLQLLSVKNPSVPTSRRVTFKAKSPRHTGNFIVGDPTLGGAKLKIALDSTTQCFSMPASGWSRFGRAYTYLDRNGALGPVKTAQFKQNGSGAIQSKAVILGNHGPLDVVPPNPGVRGDINFHVVGGGEYCASTAGGAIGPNDARNFRAKNAPAPSGCYLSACSPNGAFLDPGLQP